MASAETAFSHMQDRRPSVLMISDRLISLARDAERGGYAVTAAQLVLLAQAVFDDRHA